jgi:hypothetical protein
VVDELLVEGRVEDAVSLLLVIELGLDATFEVVVVEVLGGGN